MNPEQLLDEAFTLLNRPSRSMRRCWQRGCACLTRLALEQGLCTYWDRVAPSVTRCPMRHQLLALPAFVDASTALLARTAWHGLSRAMHHHVYELAPTVAELEGWHRDVTRLLPQLHATTFANNTSDSDYAAAGPPIAQRQQLVVPPTGATARTILVALVGRSGRARALACCSSCADPGALA